MVARSKKKHKKPLKKKQRTSKRNLLVAAIIAGFAGIFTLLFASAASDCSSPGSPCTGGENEVGSKSWQLNFNDEFNGSSVDSSKWKTQRGGGAPGGPAAGYPNYTERPYSSGENVFYKPDNPKVNNGAVTFTLTPEDHVSGPFTYQYTSGLLQSGPTYSVGPPAYIEARIKVPKCNGCWSLFWTLPEPVGTWPPEFDIFEFFQYPVVSYQKLPYFNYHWPPPDNHLPPSPYGNPSVDYTGQYHVYGMYWDGKKATPYLDGVAYPARSATDQVTSLNMYIIFQLSARRGYTVDGVKQMSIDWVRVWKPKTSTIPTSPKETESPSTPSSPSNPTIPKASTEVVKSEPNEDKTSASGSSNDQKQTTVIDVGSSTTTPQAVSNSVELKSSGDNMSIDQKIIAIDGVSISPTSKIDSTKLTNGYHTITVASTKDGSTTQKDIRIHVSNDLSLFQLIRNYALAYMRAVQRLFIDIT